MVFLHLTYLDRLAAERAQVWPSIFLRIIIYVGPLPRELYIRYLFIRPRSRKAEPQCPPDLYSVSITISYTYPLPHVDSMLQVRLLQSRQDSRCNVRGGFVLLNRRSIFSGYKSFQQLLHTLIRRRSRSSLDRRLPGVHLGGRRDVNCHLGKGLGE